MARRAGFCGDEIQIRMNAVGNEHFGAIEQPVVAIPFCRGAHARHVRAGTGFGNAHRRDDVAGDHSRQITRLLRRRARVVQVRAGHIGMHQHGDDEATKS